MDSILTHLERSTNHNETFWGKGHTPSPGFQLFLWLSLPLSIMLLLVLGIFNILVLRAILRSSRRVNVTAQVMVSMGIADTALCLTAGPALVLSDLQWWTPFYPCLVLTCTVLSWAMTSSFHHILIAYYRWYIVVHPTRYRASLTQPNILLHISLCWLAGFAVSSIPYLGYNNYTSLQTASALLTTNYTLASSLSPSPSPMAFNTGLSPRPSPGGCALSPAACRVPCLYLNVLSLQYLTYFIFFGCMLLPMVITSLLYCLIFRALWAHGRGRCLGKGFLQRQQRVVWSTGLLFSLYMLSRLPFNVTNAVLLYCPGCPLPYWLPPSALVSAVLSAASNPLLYFLRDRELLAALREAAGRLCRGRQWRGRVGPMGRLPTVDKPGLSLAQGFE
ncbi:adenosine receptor A2b-like [Huso huso]|uniref:Adenosine receptor A2b n=2 Tax=Acipenseridae TaxID=7900 RepID=A0A444UYM2_ACIRT|nr:adenosine receptor A2b-like [Acipenser ruthenus]RXM93258.1 Adenosine receptor A2b [Acipenser ruthenus]